MKLKFIEIIYFYKPKKLIINILNTLITGLLFIFLFLIGTCVRAQNLDTSRVFAQQDFLNWVKKYHPIVKQSNLLLPAARASLQAAWGNFDPKLYADIENKNFDKKHYFTFTESGVKIPTWFGPELKATYQTATGTRINSSDYLPKNGQAVLGISVPILQGLMIDERRNAVMQARILQNLNEAERKTIINDLLIDAVKAYWDWALIYNQLKIYETSVQLAEIRLQITRESFITGDKPAMDTLESFIVLQDRQLELNDAQLEHKNALLQLSNFIWSEQETPLLVRPEVRAPNLLATDDSIYNIDFSNYVLSSHPELQQLQFKLDQLNIDKRFKQNKLLPKLNINYNLLGTGFALATNGIINDAKMGLNFSFPLFLRTERGSLELARLKIQDINYKLQIKQTLIQNKIKAYENELNTNQRQIALYQQTVQNYARLLAAENEKFAIGESSIFLLNSRERKLIEARLKLAKFVATQYKLEQSIRWAAGVLTDN